jgi:hypothetical protein
VNSRRGEGATPQFHSTYAQISSLRGRFVRLAISTRQSSTVSSAWHASVQRAAIPSNSVSNEVVPMPCRHAKRAKGAHTGAGESDHTVPMSTSRR